MVEKLRGTRDFYPEQMAARRKVFDIISDVCDKFGFRETESPCIESFELIAKKSGEGIVREMYAFEDKGKRTICLRPELTPSVARMIVERQKGLTKPQKWYSIQKFWRYEEPQSGRLREFYQLNADIFGSDKPESDAELLCLGIEMLKALGLRDFVFTISDRRFLTGILGDMGVRNLEEAFRAIDKRDKVSRGEFMQGLREAGIVEQDKIEYILSTSGSIREISKFSDEKSPLTRHAVENLSSIAEILEDYGCLDYCTLDLSIARGFDYYTGMVFEVYDKGKMVRSLFGGGRYDNLVELFGGETCPAVGYAMGDVVLELMMRKEGLWPAETLQTDYFVARVGDVRKMVIELVTKLRRSHSVEYDLLSRNLTNQIKYADKIGAKKVIIVGERDLKEGIVTIRDLVSGKEERKKIDEVE
jgi:histidyl-tRNA synthetase